MRPGKSYFTLFLNLIYLTSSDLFAKLARKFDQHSDVKLGHHRFDHIGPLLEYLFENTIDILVLENQYLNHKTEEIMKLLPEYDGMNVLIADDPKKVFFAFKMGIDRCYEKTIEPKKIVKLIQDRLTQKQAISLTLEPFEKKIILSHREKQKLKIIPWQDLISFQKKKGQTMFNLTQNISFLYPVSYGEIQKRKLLKNLFYELRSGYTVNLNHLQTIKYIDNNCYQCTLSEGKVLEINSSDRSKLIKFLEQIT